MPKYALMLSTVALAAGVAACGSSNSSSSKSAPAATTSASSSTPAATSTPASTGTSATSTPASTGTSTSASSGGASGAGAGAVTVSAAASGQLMFSSNSLHASAGKVTIDFTNMAPETHNFTLADASGKVLGATPTFTGGSKSLAVDLKPGTYTFYCSVPGHEAAGMKGTLVVS